MVDGRHDLDRAERGEVAQDRALDAEVVGDDRARRRRLPSCTVYGSARGDLGDEVDAVGARLGRGRGAQRRPPTAVPNAPGIAPVSRSSRVSRRVSMPAMPLMPKRRSIASSECLGPLVAVPPGQLAHDDAATERAARLEVVRR